MKKLLFLLFFSLPVVAQGTDFAVSIDGDARHAQLRASFQVRVGWSGTEPAQNVVLEIDVPAGGEMQVNEWNGTDCTPGYPIRCTLESRETLKDGGASVTVTFPAPGSYTVTARLTSSTPDPNPANNSASRTFELAGLPALRPYAFPALPELYTIDPGGPGFLRIGVQNDGAPATDVILRATLPAGGRFTALHPYESQWCSIASETEVVCRLGNIGFFGAPVQLLLPFIAPDRPNGGTFPFRLAADAKEDDFDPANDVAEGEVLLRRLFAVTSAADEGAGSLRQAMLDTRDACQTLPCLIGVRSNEPLLIQPRTPLPRLRGQVKVDGGVTVTTLDGSLLPPGDALFYEGGCEFRVNAMVIRNFRGHAIEAHGAISDFRVCGSATLFTPVWITDNHLVANVRGIVTKGSSATIIGNVIRDHTRAGIFADGAYYTDITRNEITGNGASGIFVRAGSGGYLPAGGEIVENTIRGNAEWGIARAPGGGFDMRRNSIGGNGVYGIDDGLDFRSPSAPYRPELLWARYDAARNVTIVRVRFEPTVKSMGWRVDFYASTALSMHGHPQAERWIAETFRTGEYEVAVPGDLRGQWITATGTRTIEVLFQRDEGTRANAVSRYSAYDTSELSNAVRVE